MNTNWKYFLLVLSLYIEHDGASNVGGSRLQNPVKYEPTIFPTPFTTMTSSPAANHRTTTPGLLVSSGPNNFTVQAGAKITLQCQVDQLRDNTTVSWLRRLGDSLILVSVGKEMYSSDQRFTSTYMSAQDWRLHIDGVNVTDQGHYECQISSHPPVVHSVYIHVLVPELEIADERSLPIKNKFYNSGSTIELKCVITKVPQPTQFIIWKHNSTILNYDTTRGGISVKTDILPDGAESQLNIANVGPTDSGNYTCSLGESAVTSVSVVVITGETPAAMQQGCAKSRVSIGLLLLAADLVVLGSFS